ncbi:hypothetical protein GCM10009863_41790 [Streptomyces axinellae]|uniref:Uncharacterized protein n=1 Tax=Streptomyces axinellae TaxID=552788 RepID=A0ABN3QCX1_9ACTN
MPDQKDPRQPSRLQTALAARYRSADDFMRSPTMESPTSVFTSPTRQYPQEDFQSAPSQAQPGREPQGPAADPPTQYTQGTGTVAQGAAHRPRLRHMTGSVGDATRSMSGPIADRSAQPTSSYTTSAANVQRSTTKGASFAEREAAAKKGPGMSK